MVSTNKVIQVTDDKGKGTTTQKTTTTQKVTQQWACSVQPTKKRVQNC